MLFANFAYLLDFGKQFFGREKILLAVARTDVKITNDSILIDDDIRPFGHPPRFIIDTERLHDFAVSVTQQRVCDFCEVGKGFLRERSVAAYSKDFSILGLKHRIIVRTGRLQILDSGRTKVQNVKVYKNILALKTAQL